MFGNNKILLLQKHLYSDIHEHFYLQKPKADFLVNEWMLSNVVLDYQHSYNCHFIYRGLWLCINAGHI